MPYSYVTHTPSSASAGPFSFSSIDGWLDVSHIKVYVNGVLQTSGFTVTEVPAQVNFTSAQPAGTVIKIQRETPKTLSAIPVSFVDGSLLRGADLQLNQKHSLFLTQETEDQSVKQPILATTNQYLKWNGTAWVTDAGTGGGGGISDGDKGEISVSNSGNTWAIDAGVVTTTKMGGDVTTAGKNLLTGADAVAQRTTLGLATVASTGAYADLSGKLSVTAGNGLSGGGVLDASRSLAVALTASSSPGLEFDSLDSNRLRIKIKTNGAVVRDADGLSVDFASSGTSSSTKAVRADDSRLSDARTPTAHVHAAADVTSGTLDIARIPTGTSSTTVCIGNDSRLSDSRTPTDDSVTTAKIVDANVTYAKIQDVTAASKLLGRGDSGSGDVQEITLGSGLSMSGTTLSASGSGGAPTDASYVVIGTNGTLSAERVLTAGTGLTLTDGGANGNATLAVSYGTSSTTSCVGNDSRLSNAREALLGTKIRLFSHCSEHTPIGGAFISTGAGLAATGTEADKFGIYRLLTNTTGAVNQGGRVTLIPYDSFDFGDVTRAEFQVNMRVSTQGLSTTNTGFIIMGFHDAGSSAVVPYHGCYFRSENGGNWFAVAEANQTETTEDTGIAANSTWRTFKIVVETIGGTLTAKYYIDGTEEASLTTNIPTANRFGGGINLMRTANTTSHTAVQIDWFYYDLDHTDVTL